MASDNTIKVSELRGRSEAELESLIAGKLEELHGKRFQHALGQLRETHQLRALRRDIAKLRTVLRDKKAAS